MLYVILLNVVAQKKYIEITLEGKPKFSPSFNISKRLPNEIIFKFGYIFISVLGT
jgi:hypothetical protein